MSTAELELTAAERRVTNITAEVAKLNERIKAKHPKSEVYATKVVELENSLRVWKAKLELAKAEFVARA